jgi:hypothetical protein
VRVVTPNSRDRSPMLYKLLIKSLIPGFIGVQATFLLRKRKDNRVSGLPDQGIWQAVGETA